MKDSRAWVGAYMAYAAPIRIRMLFGRPVHSTNCIQNVLRKSKLTEKKMPYKTAERHNNVN
jgi:hypothetical protein